MRKEIVKQLVGLHDDAVIFYRAGYIGAIANHPIKGASITAVVADSGAVIFVATRKRWPWSRVEVHVGGLAQTADWLMSRRPDGRQQPFSYRPFSIQHIDS